MYELKKNGKVFTSKSVWIGPSSYEKRIYRAADSQSLRNTGLWYRYECYESVVSHRWLNERLAAVFFLLIFHCRHFHLYSCYSFPLVYKYLCSEIGCRNNFVTYLCAPCVYCLCNKSIKKNERLNTNCTSKPTRVHLQMGVQILPEVDVYCTDFN